MFPLTPQIFVSDSHASEPLSCKLHTTPHLTRTHTHTLSTLPPGVSPPSSAPTPTPHFRHSVPRMDPARISYTDLHGPHSPHAAKKAPTPECGSVLMGSPMPNTHEVCVCVCVCGCVCCKEGFNEGKMGSTLMVAGWQSAEIPRASVHACT